MSSSANNEELSTFKKVTRSLSFKHPGSSKENNVGRSGAKRSMPSPKKLDASNWFQDSKPKSSHSKEVPPGNLKCLNSVGAKASLWSKFADGHKEKQSLNPFSESFDKEKLKSLLCSKDDPNYGRPDRNSASAIRAAAGEAKMRGEICDACEVIFHNGEKLEDGLAAIQFGELFSIYNRINDKIVGLLIRARKKDLLCFEGEMLYQGKDDEEWIYLTKSINTIRVYFGRDGDIVNGGEIDEEVENKNSTKALLEEDNRRNSAVSTASLPVSETKNVSKVGESMAALALTSAAIAVATLDVPRAPSINEDVEKIEDVTEAPHSKSKESKNKLSNKSLRSSFRKMVRPMFKRNNSIKDESEDDEVCSSGRRGSWLSVRSLQSKHSESENNIDDRDLIHQRWKRVLSVSKAVGRFNVIVKSRELENEELNQSTSEK